VEDKNWTEEKLKALSKTVIGEDAAFFIKEVIESPFYESYIALKMAMSQFNADLQADSITLFNQTTIDKEGNKVIDNTFPNAHKYATEIKSYHESLEFLRNKMLPEQVVAAERESTSLIDEARQGLKKRKLNAV